MVHFSSARGGGRAEDGQRVELAPADPGGEREAVGNTQQPGGAELRFGSGVPGRKHAVFARLLLENEARFGGVGVALADVAGQVSERLALAGLRRHTCSFRLCAGFLEPNRPAQIAGQYLAAKMVPSTQ